MSNSKSQSSVTANSSPKLQTPSKPKSEAGTPTTPIQPNYNTGKKFKKMFMKFGQQVGIVKTTKFSKELLDGMKEIEQYKNVVADVCTSIMTVTQPNPKLIPSVISTMELESPKDENPFEKLARSLNNIKDQYQDKETMAAFCEGTQKLAVAQRTYQQHVRRSIHFMRTFLNVDCPIIEHEHEVLTRCRDEMDFARREYTNNPIDGNRLAHECAQQNFDAQMNKIIEFLNQLPQKKNVHSAEMIKVMGDLKAYHASSSDVCKKICKQ